LKLADAFRGLRAKRARLGLGKETMRRQSLVPDRSQNASSR